jgi:hypothetical protein
MSADLLPQSCHWDAMEFEFAAAPAWATRGSGRLPVAEGA